MFSAKMLMSNGRSSRSLTSSMLSFCLSLSVLSQSLHCLKQTVCNCLYFSFLFSFLISNRSGIMLQLTRNSDLSKDFTKGQLLPLLSTELVTGGLFIHLEIIFHTVKN